MDKNKYGLSRYIPPSVRRTIRQKAGFGCVICGFAICQYEHVDPEFSDAKKHNPDKMTLLCGRCNDKKQRGILSKEDVKRAMKYPKCLERGFTFDTFSVGSQLPKVVLCNSSWLTDKCFVLFNINKTDLFKIEPPEYKNGPFLITARFYNKKGLRTLLIHRNIWFCPTKNWDVETKAKSITIKNSNNETMLQLTIDPKVSITISKINMEYQGYYIHGDEKKGVSIQFPTGENLSLRNRRLVWSGEKVTAFWLSNGTLLHNIMRVSNPKIAKRTRAPKSTGSFILKNGKDIIYEN